MGFMKLSNLIKKLLRLILCKTDVFQVGTACPVIGKYVVSQLRLSCIRTQQCHCYERARKTVRNNKKSKIK